MNSIGALISQKRKENRITQKQLADLLHLTPSAISKWENDVAVPHISQFPQIAEALQIPVAELYALTIGDFRYQEVIGVDAPVSEEESPDVTKETITKRQANYKRKVVIFTGIAILVGLLCGIAVFVSKSFNSQPTLKIVDDYYGDQYEYYGHRDIYYIIIEYSGKLSEEFLQSYEKELRAQYSDKFEEASMIIVKLYNNRSKFDSNKDPDMKFVLLPLNKE